MKITKRWRLLLRSIWKKNTGGLVDASLENQEWKTYIESRRNNNMMRQEQGGL